MSKLDLAWTVGKIGDYWHYYNDQGESSIGFNTEDEAYEGLNRYDEQYYD